MALAVTLLVAAPTAAFWAGPATATAPPAAPGSQLAGINADATGTGIQVALLTPGLLPLGNSAVGDIIDVSAPYANSTVGTGPTTAGIATPAWPGAALANAGSLIETFSASFPTALAKLFNDPVVAQSTYPEQFNVKQSGKFAPPGAAEAGVGTSTTTSSASGTSANSELTDFVPLGSSSPLAALGKVLGKHGAGPLIEIGSTTTSSVAHVHAASVSTSAQTHISSVTIAGLIKINGISSQATTTSDGKLGKRSSDLRVGSVTVAGVPAYIGPNGIRLAGKNGGAGLVPIANTLISALNVAGITIHTVAPTGHVKGSAASVSSGAVQIGFQDNSVPNLGALFPQLPLLLPNSLGVRINLGLSQADADTTLLPTSPNVTSSPPAVSPSQSGTGTGVPPVSSAGLPPGGVSAAPPPTGVTPTVAQPVADVVFGLPVKVAWVIAAFLLSLLAAGPLLAYANWQLLRGRPS